MRIYRARLGHSAPPQCDDTWLVRARNFGEAAIKAAKTGVVKAENYDTDRDITSLELMGEEQ